jgi:ATP-dependent DNA helicase RecQ
VLRGEVHLLEPRKMWPGGAYGTRGKIAAAEMAEPGRALVYADAPEWRETVAAMFAADAAAPQEVLDASVRLLSGWRSSWVARPELVVALPAAGYPVLAGSVAGHIAAVGKLGQTELEVAKPPLDLRDRSSAEEAAFWRDGIEVRGDVAGRVLLLVVDATSSQWPITVAASKLRAAGAHAVLPLLLHRRP